MKTEVLTVDNQFGEEYAGKYVFSEIAWAKRNQIIQKYTKYSPLTGQVVDSNYVAIQAETIWACLKEQPQSKPITLQRILSEEDGIPIGLGDLFGKIANRLAGLTVEEGRFLLDPSDEKRHIPQSLSSDSAKNSAGL
jgi:hypothetical protein